MYIALIEQMVFQPPKGMENWRFYRIEYGGHARECVVEGGIWAREEVDPDYLEGILQKVLNDKEIKNG